MSSSDVRDELQPEADVLIEAGQRQHERGQLHDQHDRQRRARRAEIRQVVGFPRVAGRVGLHGLRGGLRAGRLEHLGLQAIGGGDVLVAVTARDELGVFVEHALDHRQRDAEAGRHVAADAEILRMQAHAETGGIRAANHVRRAMHEVPARARALAERIDHAIERQALRARERHRFGDRLDDPGAHDLVGGFRGLAAARRAEMGDGLAHRTEDRLRAFEGRDVTADHDGERRIPRTFGAAADGTVEEVSLRRAQDVGALARSFGAHGGAIDDDRAFATVGRERVHDIDARPDPPRRT